MKVGIDWQTMKTSDTSLLGSDDTDIIFNSYIHLYEPTNYEIYKLILDKFDVLVRVKVFYFNRLSEQSPAIKCI